MSSRPSLVDQTALTSTPYIMEKTVEDRAIAEPENSSTAVITLPRIKAAASTSSDHCQRRPRNVRDVGRSHTRTTSARPKMQCATRVRKRALQLAVPLQDRPVGESTLESAFLNAATTSSEEKAWFTEIFVGSHGSHKVTFKLDTGAEVTAVSQETYQMLPDAPPLSTPL